MSNIRKSFSFRDGVQVDQDIFVVRGSLVGIGTSVPRETFDVRGVASITGLVTTTTLISGVSTIGNLRVGIVSVFPGGIITATSSSGIVTYFGDGGRLLNLPTSQWLDVDVGLGFTSIYAQGNVGIATSNPGYTFQIGSNPDTGMSGVGVNSTGNIRATGIVTAGRFSGIGSNITNINADNISLGTLSNSRLPIIANDRFASNISISGILTAGSAFFGTIVTTGNITGIAETARGLIGQPSIDIWNLIVNRNAIISGITTTAHLVSTGASIGIATVTSILNIGVGGTILTALESGRIGIGSNLPTSDLQLRRTGNALFEVVGESGQSRISIGQSVGIGNSATLLRFGGTPRSFEIVNNDYGSFNFALHGGDGVGLNTGGFNWIHNKTNKNLLSLTYQGNLGVGRTNPRETFEVVGTSTITSNSFVGGNLSIVGGIEAGTGINRVSFGLGEENLLNNTNIIATNGISTVSALNVIGVGSIGIQTASPIAGFDARPVTGLFAGVGIKTSSIKADFHLVGKALISEGIGIGTTAFNKSIEDEGAIQIYNQGLSIHNAGLVLKGFGVIGVGTNLPASCLDLSQALSPLGTKSVFLAPSVSNTELSAMGFYQPEGGLVYNREIKTFQYTRGNGSEWIDMVGPWTLSNDFNTNGIYHINQDSGSTVGIGTSIPTATLSVIGDIDSTATIRSPYILVDKYLYVNEGYFQYLEPQTLVTVGLVTALGVNAGFNAIGGARIGVNTEKPTDDVEINGGVTLKGNASITGNININGITTSSAFVSSVGMAVSNTFVITGGITTSVNGFNSGVGTASQITTIGNRIYFTVPGVGSTSFRLY